MVRLSRVCTGNKPQMSCARLGGGSRQIFLLTESRGARTGHGAWGSGLGAGSPAGAECGAAQSPHARRRPRDSRRSLRPTRDHEGR
ncbi:hypothetical protein RR46_04678 [Papilio xuthus]|uniref:Uncharacterized protein n=1 Tax=Papilio xuthus TaxID=66420 RepID=A0A194Q5N2_PAPXU|nr:hypothetical protein RR46_04678 [Papilio xuthus]